MDISARVVLDSLAPSGGRLTTFEVTFPRFILAEFNTHRIFSRNSASSRAIPVTKQCERVELDPFVPKQWGKNQKGMQAGERLTCREEDAAVATWLDARDVCASTTARLADLGVHKQHASRLIEPFMWHTAVVSATHWGNFFGLRDSKMAQPEFRDLAHVMREKYGASTPVEVPSGSWHLPFVTDVDRSTLELDGHDLGDLVKISAARCARVSYRTHDGRRDPAEDLALYDRLVQPGHMSPLEHPAMSLSQEAWREYGERLARAWVDRGVPIGNYWGWAQHRKFILWEDDFSARVKGEGP